jgi:hypothetical protein
MKLVPFKPSMLKQMGIVNTSKGPMIDKSKLVDNKKYVKPEKPEVKQLKKDIKEQAKQKPRITVEEKKRQEDRGIY